MLYLNIKSKIEEKGYHISKSGNRITSLGSPQNLSQDGRAKSIETRRLKALHNPNNKRAYGMVKMLSDKTLKQTADFLNENGFPTSTGKQFTPMAVSNLKKTTFIMIKVNITEDQLKRVKELYKFGELNNSITLKAMISSAKLKINLINKQ